MSTASTTPLFDRLRAIVGGDGILTAPSELLVYECDGFTIEKNKPDVVVFPTSTEQIVQIVGVCNELEVPFLPRGAGTSLSGGCLPVGGGVMIFCCTIINATATTGSRLKYGPRYRALPIMFGSLMIQMPWPHQKSMSGAAKLGIHKKDCKRK